MMEEMVFQSRGDCWYCVPVDILEEFRRASDDLIDLLFDKYRCAAPSNYRVILTGDV